MTAETAAILANDLLTPAEVQRILRCGKNSLYNSIKSQEIPAFKFGASYRVPAAWLRAKPTIASTANQTRRHFAGKPQPGP